jgi:molybdopterin/thiamine biosynthesis adenylyltransferase
MTQNTTIRIKIIGCGGIGGHLARNLCHFLHAERRAAHVVLVDGDAFEERNRNRMRFTRLENKAVAMARELAQSFGGGALTVEPVPEYVTPENVEGIVEEGDLVFLAVDNHATRRVVGTACAARRTVTLLSGGNDGVEDGRAGTYGNVQIVRRENGRDCTSPLDRYHPEIAEARDKLPTERGCAEQAEAGAPQLLFTNLAVASAALNAFYGLLSGRAAYEEVYLDILKNRMTPVVRAPVAADRQA